MDVVKFKPATQLRRFIKCYYYLENTGDALISDTYFADGCIEAVFSLGWNFYKDGCKENWAKVIGQIIKPRKLKIVGKGQSFGIWFYPHAFSFFSKIAVFEINDAVLPWDVLFPNSFAEFVGNCIYERRFDKLINGADEFLLKTISRYREKPIDRLTESAIGYLYQYKHNADLNHLASSMNVSQRYLQKAFLTKVGFSQKQFIRILRFQQALQMLGRHEKTLTDLAYENEFYDQSHFIKEFKVFTGLLPSEFEAEELPINRYFITPD